MTMIQYGNVQFFAGRVVAVEDVSAGGPCSLVYMRGGGAVKVPAPAADVAAAVNAAHAQERADRQAEFNHNVVRVAEAIGESVGDLVSVSVANPTDTPPASSPPESNSPT